MSLLVQVSVIGMLLFLDGFAFKDNRTLTLLMQYFCPLGLAFISFKEKDCVVETMDEIELVKQKLVKDTKI